MGRESTNRYIASGSTVPITVYLTPSEASQLVELASRNQTKPYVYAGEMITVGLMAKRRPNIEPNEWQRMAVEAAVTASGVE